MFYKHICKQTVVQSKSYHYSSTFPSYVKRLPVHAYTHANPLRYCDVFLNPDAVKVYKDLCMTAVFFSMALFIYLHLVVLIYWGTICLGIPAPKKHCKFNW